MALVPTSRFTEGDWARVERDTMAWWAGELERPLVWLAVTDPIPREKPYAYLSNYPLDMPANEVVDQHEPFWAATHFTPLTRYPMDSRRRAAAT
jgi:hypothetical protein